MLSVLNLHLQIKLQKKKKRQDRKEGEQVGNVGGEEKSTTTFEICIVKSTN